MSRTPEQILNNNKGRKGRQLSAETKAKISATKKGKPLSIEHKKKIYPKAIKEKDTQNSGKLIIQQHKNVQN